jgi:tetratricopeptide (TPR) repeat protein
MTPCDAVARAVGLIILTAGLAGPAAAQSLRDPAWDQWLDTDGYVELDTRARERLKAQPGDPQATLALAFVALSNGAAAKIDAALPAVEACLAAHPQAGECHYAQGMVVGAQALRAGMFKAMRMAGTIRESFEKAVALQPDSFNHRAGLMQFYLAAPGMAGGGVDKARALAKATEAVQPEQARCLRAMVALYDDQYAEAEALLWAVQPGKDTALRSTVYSTIGQIALQHLNEKRPQQAQPVLEHLLQADPSRALAPYAMGRLKAETGAPQEALRHYAQARTLRGHSNLPLDYREALAWLLLGDSAKAKTLLQRFVEVGRGGAKNLDDAKEKLAKLS